MIKTIGIDNDINITDDLRFIISTTDSNGCLKTPYKIDKVSIYFISREFTDTTVTEYSNEIIKPSLLKEYESIKQASCVSPTQENLNKLTAVKSAIDNSKFTSSFFFKEAIPIKVFGGYVDNFAFINKSEFSRRDLRGIIEENREYFPAWLNPDLVPIDVKAKVQEENILYEYEENREVVEGKFVLEWSPIACREGDYFICWNWTPNIAGDSLSSHMMFRLGADSKATASIPTHVTKKDKYEILMERYLPEMFKNILSENDLTPYVLQELNLSIAKGFTFLEDMSNQIIDMLDANAIHEQLLPLLSNMFNLKLKSNDPTLWRRQTKKAISNFKRKGTITGLKSALSDAGMKFLKLTKLWQIFSKYTYQEVFTKTSDSNEFILSKGAILPIHTGNFEIWHRPKDSNYWQQLSYDYVNIEENSGVWTCTWIGGDLPSNSISLDLGDSVRLLYQIMEIPNEEEQNLELYIRMLDLMDQRDERDQQYPPKNWNTRVIEEDDPLFDVLIPIKHPIHDLITWGRVRTEFPYSENIYNMEEYNGSTRDSKNPCDIDKNFIDPCKDCQASSISIDVEIENLSNDRIKECEKTIEEFIPFHSLIHSVNFLGSKNEFMKPPLEEIKALIRFSKEDVLISGEAQLIFNRSIANENLNLVKRNILSSMESATETMSGIGRNSSLVLFAPNLSTKSDLENSNFIGKSSRFDRKNISLNDISGDPFENSNLLEILAPSTNAGAFSVSSVSENSFEVISRNIHAVSEPLDKSQFEFRISNKIYNQSSVNISQNDIFIFSDDNFKFHEIEIISLKDIENGISSGNVTKIIINDNDYFEYDIVEVLPDNKLIINGPLNSDEFYINKTNIVWQLVGGSLENVTGNSGYVKIIRRGLVNLSPSNPPAIDDIKDLAKAGDYVLYGENQYKLKSFVDDESYQFYIENYIGGDVGGVEITIYRRVVENCVGQLDYSGLELKTSINYESGLGIQNGANSNGIITKNSNLKENYLILIDSEYYSILDINGTTIVLDGPNKDWTTLGTEVDFVIYRFINLPVDIPETLNPKIPGHYFEQVSRSNNEVITNLTAMSILSNKVLNSINSGNEFIDSSGQEESINFNIEYKDGNNEEKEI